MLTLSLLAWAMASLALLVGAATAYADENQDSFDGFRMLTPDPATSTGADVIDVLLPYLRGHPEALEGRPQTSLSIREGGDALLVDIIKTGYLDDSVSGEHHRGIVVPTPGGWELTQIGVMPICARGDAVDGRCP
jgi:hypothetical protein